MLKKIMMILAVMGLMSAYAGQAGAYPADDMAKQELGLLVKSFNDAAARKDSSIIVNNMPERLYAEMAKRMNTSEQALRAALKQSVDRQLAAIPAGGYHLDDKNIQFREAKDGEPYALVPTEVKTAGGAMRFMTLAIMDNTQWHLIYGGQKTVQNPIFLEIYPYAADISMPAATETAGSVSAPSVK